MPRKRILLLLFGLLVFFGVSAVLVARQRLHSHHARPKTAQNQANNVVGKNVTFTVTQAEHRKWDVHALQATYFADQNGADLQGVDGYFYDDTGKKVGSFRSQTGVFDKRTKSMILNGQVEVRSLDDSGVVLKAPRLRWSTNAKNAVASGGIRLSRKDAGDSTADECDFTLDFHMLKLRGNAYSNMTISM